MSPPASGDARPTSRHAAGGRRAAGRGSGNDPGRRSGDSSAPEANDSGDDLGIAAWLDSAGQAPHETGPLLPGFAGLIGAETGTAPAGDAAAPGHVRASEPGPGHAADDGSDRRPASKHAASGRAPESRHAAGPGPGSGSGDVGSTDRAAESPRPDESPRPAESSRADGSARSRRTETRARAAEAAEPNEPNEPAEPAGSGEAQERAGRASRHAGGRRAASRRSGPVPTGDATVAAAPSAPVFGTPFWSGPSQMPDPDDPLGLDAPEADADATRAVSKHASPGRRAASRASGPAAAPAPEPTQVHDAATRLAPPPAENPHAAAFGAGTVAAPPTIHAFAPALAPDPIDEDEVAPEREPSARTGGGSRGRSPSTKPRRTAGDPPQRATGGALAACLVVAAVLGFAGGAWFGSRPDDGGAAGDARTSDPDAQGPGEPAPPAEGLTLTADPVSVAPNDLIALAGTLAPAEGGVEVTLQHRVGDGEWVDYPASRPLTFTTREDGSFSGSVATDAPGPNFFRVVNVDDAEETSPEIEVAVTE